MTYLVRQNLHGDDEIQGEDLVRSRSAADILSKRSRNMPRARMAQSPDGKDKCRLSKLRLSSFIDTTLNASFDMRDYEMRLPYADRPFE
jgi:hypothetical protein